MDELGHAIVQIAIQVPALALVSFVLLRVTTMIMDMQGKKLDDLTQAVDRLIDEVRRR